MASTNRAPRGRSAAFPQAAFIEPMKALGVSKVPTGMWHCEIKFDGYRAEALIDRGSARLWSRNRKEMSADYPEIVAALKKVKCRTAVMDGEIVALDAEGRSHFQLLQGRDLAEVRPVIVFYVFDLMQLDGKALVALPIEARRQRLEILLGRRTGRLQLSPKFVVEPAELMQVARERGLEGIIAKKTGSFYEPGRRSGAWVKCKIVLEQEFVVAGFTPPQNSRQGFGAILVGYYEKGKLLYAGKVGTGFSAGRLRSLHDRFLRLRNDRCPFANLPMASKPRFGQGMTHAEMKKVTWLRPELVAQIKFAEWTQGGILRQPVFLGLRTDKTAREVRREKSTVG